MSLYDETQGRILAWLDRLQGEVNRLKATRSPFTILNENTPAQITANTDNYVPGNYDSLRLSTDASRNLTGISGGKKGRVLWILNVGAQNIVLVHQSASSDAANRMISPTAANITLGANDSAILYYDSTDSRWRFASVSV